MGYLHRQVKRIVKVLIILAILVGGWYSLFFFDFSSPKGPVYGVSYASSYAWHLGLDPKEVYLKLLDDLKVRNIRISVFWNQIEPKQGFLDFSELDWLMGEAQKRDAKIILAVGRRVPRWPECHTPLWARQDGQAQEDQFLLAYLKELVKHGRDYPSLRMWQVENEPFLDLFGECPKRNKKLLLQEIALVRELDPKTQIMVTDSGEFGSWLRTRKLGDYLGTSIYRVVAQSWSGYIKYGGFIPPAYYRLKAFLIRKPTEKIIVSELQAEPWTPKELLKTSLSEQLRSMNLEQFNKNIDFARRTGFSETYLWGAEWWYYMKIKQNDPSFWEEARGLFR